MSTYTVKLSLNHNGKAYEPGETIELDEKTAEVLVKDGVVTDGTASTEEAPKAPEAAPEEAKPTAAPKAAKGGKSTKASKKDEADDL